MMKLFLRCVLLAVVTPLAALSQGNTRWLPFGPDGGDARSFAADPADHRHIFLGTVSGTIYDTHDGGRTWKWLAEPGKRDDLAFDNLLVDPSNSSRILAAGWAIDREDGGLYISTDGGKTWQANAQLKGHSIRSMAVAPSNPKILLAGALDGVYRSRDGGSTWTLISPKDSAEIHEIESVAIDPKNPDVLYAGTWHLPWKTVDGGQNWTNMKEGIIDDSDVFSIIVDPERPSEIFLSACSGIYRSSDSGEKFVKVQGIPSTARRTRVLMQDARHLETVFAGTTEGLWRTTDSGRTFLRYGDPGWVINDVSIDPTDGNHVLLATDRNGVLLSEDGGLTFGPANRGFSSRQISSIAQDRDSPSHLWVAVLNDKDAGGVFTSSNGGVTWQQSSTGLNGADVFSLAQAPDGTLLAGTRHSIFSMTANGYWQNTGLALAGQPTAIEKKAAVSPKRVPRRLMHAAETRRTSAKRPSAASGRGTVVGKRGAPSSAEHATSVGTGPEHDASADQARSGVFALLAAGKQVFAGTEDGLFASSDNGKSWVPVSSMEGKPWHLLAAGGLRVVAADQQQLALSVDHGQNFLAISKPPELSSISSITVDSGGRLWAGGPQGVFFSENDGAVWTTLKGLFVPNVTGLAFDSSARRVLVTASTIVYSVHIPDLSVTYNDTGWHLRSVLPVMDHLVGITPFDGVVLQPRMVVSDMTPYR